MKISLINKILHHKRLLPTAIIVLILLLSAFLRLYRINEYIIFLGDEGRDVLVVKRIIVDHKFTLLGPITSVGSMYMGPIYYYFMVPFLLLFNFNPVGPAIMVVLFSLATIYLIYYILKKYVSLKSAILASFLYAISPLTIIHGRSSWNPNLVPFFSLLIVLGLLKVVVDRNPKWALIVGLAFGISFQLHYVSLLLVPLIFASLALIRFRLQLKYYLYLLGGFILTFSPFIIFELRHQFTNSRAVVNFFLLSSKTSTGVGSTWDVMADILVRLFWRLVIIENAEVTKVLIVLILTTLSIYVYKLKNMALKHTHLIFLFWLVIGLVSFGIYKGIIYDYYFVPMFTLPFILTAIFLDRVWSAKKVGMIVSITLFILITFFNLKKSPLFATPNNLLKNTEEISKFVYSQIGGRPYNFALIANRNSDHAYRYFLEVWGNPPITIENPTLDPDRKTVTSELYVVCEEKVCQPLGHPLWEIAGFGPAEIAQEWHVSTARVYKLVPFTNDK